MRILLSRARALQKSRGWRRVACDGGGCLPGRRLRRRRTGEPFLRRISFTTWFWLVYYVCALQLTSTKLETGLKVTATAAFHLEATSNVVFMGKKRKAGDVWLLTSEHTDTIVPPIGVVITGTLAQE